VIIVLSGLALYPGFLMMGLWLAVSRRQVEQNTLYCPVPWKRKQNQFTNQKW